MTRTSILKNILAIIKILAGLALLILSIQGIHWENLAYRDPFCQSGLAGSGDFIGPNWDYF